jgi:hypothetical protein
MNRLGSSLFRLADDVAFSVQNAGKTFGFLSDGRDLVEIVAGSVGSVAILPDHEDEGWPELRIVIPEGAQFQYAASGPLTRVAIWTVDRPLADVVRELTSRPDGPPEPSSVAARVVFDLGGSGELRLKAAESERTLIVLRQRRDPDAVVTVLKSRSAR